MELASLRKRPGIFESGVGVIFGLRRWLFLELRLCGEDMGECV